MRIVIVILLLVFAFGAVAVLAQETPLESRVSRLERAWNYNSTGAVVFLFGAFCALWAQNTGRSAWLWFFLGVFFSVITVLVLLAKNPGMPRKVPG